MGWSQDQPDLRLEIPLEQAFYFSIDSLFSFLVYEEVFSFSFVPNISFVTPLVIRLFLWLIIVFGQSLSLSCSCGTDARKSEG